MSRGWGDLYAGRKAIQRRFGRIHKLPVVRRIHEVLVREIAEGARVLDVGAGGRRLSETLAAKGLHIDYHSVDQDRSVQHDYAAIDAVDERFDVVTCFEVLEHVPLPEIADMLGHMHRVLNSGGTLYVSTPNVYKPQEFLRDATHCTPLCYDQLAGMIEAAGFDVTAIYRGCGDRGLRKLLRRVLFGWLFRLLDIDYARQILVRAAKT